MLSDAFNKFATQAQPVEVQKPQAVNKELFEQVQKRQEEALQQERKNQPLSAREAFKLKMKEHQEMIEREQPYTIVFTNCGPNLTKDKLKTLVSHRLGIPFIFKSKEQLLQLKPDGKIVPLESNPVKESDLQITRVYFSSDNYRHFDKETYKYVETEKDIYRNKVGFVVFNQKVTEEMVTKCKVIRTKDRTLFANFTIHDSINKATALYVVHVRPTTDL